VGKVAAALATNQMTPRKRPQPVSLIPLLYHQSIPRLPDNIPLMIIEISTVPKQLLKRREDNRL
jgi:hypothetical protein